MALTLAWEQSGLKLKDLAERAGGLDYVTVSAAIGRFRRRQASDAELQGLVERARKFLMSIAKI